MALSIVLVFLGFISASNSNQKLRFDAITDFKQTQITTCTTPKKYYVTLNTTQPSVQSYYRIDCINGTFVAVDLFFQGTWQNSAVEFTVSTFTYSFSYTSPSIYPITSEFCDNLTTEIKTINFTLKIPTSEYMYFTSKGQGNAQVSIENIYFSQAQCYPSCKKCTGSQFNQCTSCYYGLPTNNICPSCPQNQFYTKFQGCNDICSIRCPFYYNGFCQYYPIYIIEQIYIERDPLSIRNLQWTIMYDPLNIDISPKPQYSFGNNYGIFKFNSGIYYFITKLSTYTFGTYLIGLQVTIFIFDDIPLNCGIQFKINNTYYGSIFKNDQGIQTHKFKIYYTYTYPSYQSYTFIREYVLISYLDIPKLPILFSAVGNYSVNTAGWGIESVYLTSGYCSQGCLICEVSFKCKTCAIGYYYYRDGSCIGGCLNFYQKLNGNYCYDYDDETPYSQYLIQEYIDKAVDPEQYAQYTLLSEKGTNFLKGSDIYYSYWQSYRVFGGPFVWAQAKFQRIHNIVNPHHSVTIGFYIIYGPQFPPTSRFIYTIENNAPVTKSIEGLSLNQNDGSQSDKVYERITHNTNTLTITWECFGLYNEPIKAYCAFYQYYIAVHYCQPYCLQCTDQNTCTQWNSTYNANIVRFSQSECQNNQYFDRESFRCLQCLQPCLTCTSKIDCLTCQSTYTQTRLGCVCLMNQYEDQNQCFNCPIECNQCRSSTYCIECLFTNYRQFVNGQCECINGYYPIISNPQCQLCHKFCKTCTGPTQNDCSTCANIINIAQIGSTCICPTATVYQDSTKSCSNCHYSCQTCFRITINGCLTCNPSQNRILKGLKCECAPGYYELNSICANCPTQIDVSLIQCFKQCNNNLQIWHTSICNSCDPGYQIVFGECQPICGDSQIKGYEQCEDGNTILDDLCYNCQFQCPIHCQSCDQTTTLPCPDICGDGIITGIEQCEDGNTIQYDGCFNCQYQCQSPCTKCLKGECFECATPGWYVDPLVTPWQCKQRCGDGLIVGSEQCEDGNSIDTDGCKDCKYYCRIGCSSCDYTNNTCLSCESPGLIPLSYYCKNICGDGIVANDPSGFYSEECDDSNTINEDGCNNFCQFQCQPTSICTSCVNNRCQICASGYLISNDQICIPICGDSMLVTGEPCEDEFTLPYKGCQNCKPSCQNSCLICSNTGLGCNSCKTGYKRIDYLCYSICGDNIVTDDEQCDDGNFILGDGCHFCQFSCQNSCLNCIKGVCYDCLDGYQLILSKCYPICKNEFITNIQQCKIQNQLMDIQILFLCVQYCVDCQYNLCQSVQNNLELDQLNQSLQMQYNEQQLNCNLLIHNQCMLCQTGYLEFITNTCIIDYNMNKCSNNCILCLLDQCLECEYGYYENNCIPKCGDGIVVLQEECDDDDGILFQIDLCFNCKVQCPSFCQNCAYGICTQCYQGFQLDIVSNSCNSICGDKLLVKDEVCDDGNEVEYDGCYECKYQCPMNCLDCYLGKCEQCMPSFIFFQSKNTCEQQQNCENLIGLYYNIVDNVCLPLCGDGIVAENEQCDDENQIKYDGCFNCQYQCHEMCNICLEGNCQSCISTYQLIDNQCIVIQENIQDQNLFNNELYDEDDNENKVKKVKNQTSNQNQEDSDNLFESVCRNTTNECVYFPRPKMELNYNYFNFNIQHILINFNQQVKLINQQTNQMGLFNITIQDLDIKNYNIKLQSIQDISYDLDQVQYEVVVEILIPLQNKPILIVSLIQDVINSNNQTIRDPQQSLQLRLPQILPEKMKLQSIQTKKSNVALMIGTISISFISLLSGESSVFIEILNILQYQCFFKYINVEYPENIYIYFQAQEILSINTYLKITQFNEYLDLITQRGNNNIQLDGKFSEYNIEADLFINIFPQAIQFLGLILLISVSKSLYNYIFTLFSNWKIILWNLSIQNDYFIKLITLLSQFENRIKKLIYTRFVSSSNLLSSLIYINSWDLIHSVILQTKFTKICTIRDILSTTFAYIILLCYLDQIFKSLKQCYNKKHQNSSEKSQIQFQNLEICRTLFFHVVLILFQKQQILQCLLLFFSSLTQLYLIYKFKQCSKIEKIISLIVEGTLSLFISTLFFYLDFTQKYISYEHKLKVGIIHMSLLLVSIIIVFFKNLIQKAFWFYNLLRPKKTVQSPSQILVF